MNMDVRTRPHTNTTCIFSTTLPGCWIRPGLQFRQMLWKASTNVNHAVVSLRSGYASDRAETRGRRRKKKKVKVITVLWDVPGYTVLFLGHPSIFMKLQTQGYRLPCVQMWSQQETDCLCRADFSARHEGALFKVNRVTRRQRNQEKCKITSHPAATGHSPRSDPHRPHIRRLRRLWRDRRGLALVLFLKW